MTVGEDDLYVCERAGAQHAEQLLALFESNGSGCFCNYWYFEGDKNAWLERCYIKPEDNRAALVARLAQPELCGVVALHKPDVQRTDLRSTAQPSDTRPSTDVRSAAQRSDTRPTPTDHAVVGWLNLSRVSTVPKLFNQRVYRNLPCFQGEPGDRENVFAVACCYVAEAERGRGVAHKLLSAAIAEVRAAGGSAIEAFPRATPEAEKLRADELLLGPEQLFLAAGFKPVSDFRPYPVLRLHLP
ncbi:MAG TPA: GNAT family N-acetyltransferase [Polyangiaceae bacterium]|nr:GNAT family N-acetyltransferase [Polyangiaceae bacterium]